MREQNNKKLNNDGFSLVELIVVILLTGFVSLMISTFISMARVTFERVNREAVLQVEVQSASSFMKEIARVSSESDYVDAATVTSLSTAVNNGVGIRKVLWFRGHEYEYSGLTNGKEYYYFFILDDANSLRYGRVEVGTLTDSQLYQKIADYFTTEDKVYCLLADYIEDLNITAYTKSVGLETLYVMDYSFKYHDYQQDVSIKVSARNK